MKVERTLKLTLLVFAPLILGGNFAWADSLFVNQNERIEQAFEFVNESKSEHLMENRASTSTFCLAVSVNIFARTTQIFPKEQYLLAQHLNEASFAHNPSELDYYVGGNNYRVVTEVVFKEGIVRIAKVGAHAEYDG